VAAGNPQQASDQKRDGSTRLQKRWIFGRATHTILRSESDPTGIMLEHAPPALLRTSRSHLLAAVALAAICLAPSVARAAWPDVNLNPPEQGGGEGDAAVIVGIEDYVFVPDVEGAVDNAQAWYTYLVRGRGVLVDHVTLLRNNEGTREKILRKVEEAAGQSSKGGRLWIIFVGHGAPGPGGSDGALVGADAQAEVESLYARSFTRTELLAAASKGKQANTVVILDACFSGRVASGKPLVEGLQPLLPVAEQGEAGRGVLLFSAAASDQFAGPLPNVKRPAFSYLMLGALRGWGDHDRDGSVTAKEAVDYAREALAATVNDRAQVPSLAGAPQTVLSSGSLEAGPDMAKLALAPQTGAGTVTVTAGGPGQLLLSSLTHGAFDVEVISSAGQSHSCASQLTAATPCKVSGLATGQARVRLTGEANVSETIEIRKEPVVVEVEPPNTWTGTAALIGAGVGLGGLALAMSSNTKDSLAAFVSGALIGELGLGAFMGFGVWWMITDYSFEETQLGRQPESRSWGKGLLFNFATPWP
jgi:hypothetical protein